ncbi:MAG: hypothetical protein WA790_03175 [Sulfitobacter sp.]
MSSYDQWIGTAAVVCTVMAASISAAQTLEVTLGGKNLGTLTYSKTAKIEKLRSSLDNTPLGVFNGTFSASARSTVSSTGMTERKYQSISKSSRKTRKVAIFTSDGRVIETSVTPQTEMTKLSEPTRVPAGVVDPVGAIGRLMWARGCPKALTIYDGRRAIALTPNGSMTADDQLICALKYNVVAGPGHLSPLYISKVKMQIQYDLTNGKQKLTQIKMGSGLFNLVLKRKN